jgi:hypothetical protein
VNRYRRFPFPEAAFTIALIASRIAGGKSGQASTNSAKPGSPEKVPVGKW